MEVGGEIFKNLQLVPPLLFGAKDCACWGIPLALGNTHKIAPHAYHTCAVVSTFIKMYWNILP